MTAPRMPPRVSRLRRAALETVAAHEMSVARGQAGVREDVLDLARVVFAMAADAEAWPAIERAIKAIEEPRR